MAVSPEFPNLAGLSQQAAVRQLAEYVYGLSEQLNFALHNLHTGNFSADTAAMLTGAAQGAAAAERKATELAQKQQQSEQALKEAVLAQAELTLSEVAARMAVEQDAILSQVAATYTTAADTAALEARLSSTMEQTAKDLTLRFDGVNTYAVEVEGKLQELLQELRTYIRFDAEGIALGKVGSAFGTLLNNTRLSFLQNGVEIAYISNHTMYITRAEVAERLSLGSPATGYYDFRVEDNGSLSLARRDT